MTAQILPGLSVPAEPEARPLTCHVTGYRDYCSDFLWSNAKITPSKLFLAIFFSCFFHHGKKQIRAMTRLIGALTMGQESCRSGGNGSSDVSLASLLDTSPAFDKDACDAGDGPSTKKMKIASLTEEDLGRSIRVDSLMNDEPSPSNSENEFSSSLDYKTLYLRESAKNEQLLQWVAQLQSHLNQQLQNSFIQPQTIASPLVRPSRSVEKEKGSSVDCEGPKCSFVQHKPTTLFLRPFTFFHP